MNEFVQFAKEFGPWFGFLLSLAYIIATKIWPEWVATRRGELQQEHQAELASQVALVNVYEKFIAQNEQTVRLLTVITTAANGMERALDANTVMVNRVLEAITIGPSCPLPDCPFFQQRIKQEETP